MRYISLVLMIILLFCLSFSADLEEEAEFIETAFEYIENYEFEKAEEIINGILEDEPDNPRALNTLAFLRAKEFDFIASIDIWKEVEELNPDMLSPYLYPGIAYIKLGEVEEAIIMLNKGIIKFPSNANLHYNLGVAYHYTDEIALAEEEYWKAHELQPDHPQTLYNLALIAHTRGDENAKELWEMYIEVAGDDPREHKYVERAVEFLSDIIYENIEENMD
jgi:tetratricopeptide (TPR) repeat protein